MIPALLIGAAAILLTLTLILILVARIKATGDLIGLAVFFLAIANVGASGLMVYSAFKGAEMVSSAISQQEDALAPLIEQQRLLDAQSIPEAPEAVAPIDPQPEAVSPH